MRRGTISVPMLALILALAPGCSEGGPVSAARTAAPAVEQSMSRRGGSSPAAERRLDARAVRLRELLDLGLLDQARPLLDQLASTLGPEAELLSARAAALGGDWTEATRCIERARAQDPTDVRVYATAAELHAAAGRLETAGGELARGAAACGITPEIERAQGVLELSREGGAGRGLALIERALARDPWLPFVARAQGQANLLLAKRAMAERRPREALALVRRSLQHDPGEADAQRFLADALSAAGDFEGALAVLERLAEAGEPLAVELALSHKKAAMAAILAQRRPEALEHLRRARDLGLTPEELGSGADMLLVAADEEVRQGSAAYRDRDLAAARAHFERALELDPDHLSAHNHLAVVLLGLEEPAPAAEHWRHVLDVAAAEGLDLPDPVHLNLATALVRQGEREAARALLSQHLERAPDGCWAADTRRYLEALDREDEDEGDGLDDGDE